MVARVTVAVAALLVMMMLLQLQGAESTTPCAPHTCSSTDSPLLPLESVDKGGGVEGTVTHWRYSSRQRRERRVVVMDAVAAGGEV